MANTDDIKTSSSQRRVIEIPEPLRATLVVDNDFSNEAEPNSMIIRTSYTSVSPGTELLVFQGDLPDNEDDDDQMDSTIEQFKDQDMNSYPYRYGYSAVGRITHLNLDNNRTANDGDNNDNKEVSHKLEHEHEHENENEKEKEKEEADYNVGDRVFIFREHASHFKAKANDIKGVLKVPKTLDDTDTLTDQDISVLPAIETAVSIIFDTHPLPGECIGIIGQGLIGLLVTSISRYLFPLNTIITFDLSQHRRNQSTTQAKAHLSIAANTSLDDKLQSIDDFFRHEEFQGFDQTIEVSGASAGLNGALQLTRDYGKVVLASWYGNKPVVVPHLGSAKFHRSHIQILSSQVSDCHHLGQRWSKQRRFELVWKLLRDIRPASKFDIPVFNPVECQNVYEQLQKKDIIAALFKWS